MTFLRRWADAALQTRIATLESALEAEQRCRAVAEAEIESMAAVIARDRARIEAESAAYSRARAESEGTHEQRDIESLGRRIA